MSAALTLLAEIAADPDHCTVRRAGAPLNWHERARMETLLERSIFISIDQRSELHALWERDRAEDRRVRK